MEALGLAHPRLSSLSSHYDYQRQHCKKPLDPTHCFSVSKPSSQKIRPFYGNHQKGLNSIRMQAVDEDFELKQMKDMAAARKRWEALVREEKVKVLTPREAGYAIQLSNKTLLDVRPSTEHNK
ncbi:Rhodanese-like domain-containing protein, partial [Actinidia chinensis var. chinensis]